ncbi:MAG TPA: PP2C family protein-serine/threonine phosphatase, partial [Turneriella sp.]|nr:PP2C family protein-serine/threonine phosphatase [Turneriella sp.]
AITVAALYSVKLESYHYLQGLVMDVIFSFIHGGFCLILSEIATGSMRSECKRIMNEKKIPFTDRAVTTVRLKLAFFITLFLVTVYISSTLVYYNRDNLSAIFIFTLMATATAVLMAYMIFYLIYSALKDIENSMDDLKRGGSGLIFTKSIDSEFVKVATGISDAARTIKDYQANLEQKIDERTHELQESLGNVRALKGQQDGDYFLTSLLLKPLSGNYANNRQIKVSMFTRQKKRFEFKTRTEEIGGDISLAHSIRLRDRDYTLFLNGDAMGKSMQGAGGSLVLGAVMQSIIERTKLSPKEQVLYPERWLKSVFLELQKTFESFDGSMLISVVLGLADEKSGFVYFINAEHPWSVVYRSGKAFFVENDLTLRKLGTLGVAMGIRVQTYELQPHDKFIIGSDGRDDLMLGNDEEGARIINEDETLILRQTE